MATSPADPRHLTVARCDQLLTIYVPWLHAKTAATRKAAERAVDGLMDERKAAVEREPA